MKIGMAKWLALHNFRSNPEVLREQLKEYLPLLGDDVEVEFLAAPHPARGPSLFPGEPKEWWYSPTYKSFLMGWLGDLGLEESKEYLRNIVKNNGPYEGVIGFSQGGGMSHFLLSEGLVKRGILFSPVVPLGHTWSAKDGVGYEAIAFVDPADLTGENYPLEGIRVVTHAENHSIPKLTEHIASSLREFLN